MNTANSGSVEIDNQGRTNLIWFANKKTGESFEKGVYQHDAEWVKLALHSDSNKIHPFPTGSLGLLMEYCEDCGKQI